MSEAPQRQPRPDTRWLSSGWGMLIGGVVGFLGPILIVLLAQLLFQLNSGFSGGGIAIMVITVMPLPLLLLGLVLVCVDSTRGWGVAALVAAGVWLLTTAGVCVVVLIGLSSA